MGRITAQFNGACWICHEALPKGSIIDYDHRTKAARHTTCDEEPTTRSPEQLAAELGYRPHGESCEWSGVPTRREVLHLLAGDRSDSTGRPEPEAQRNFNPTLFKEE